MNLFDRAASLTFDVTTNIMGYDATWYKRDSTTEAGRVHFKDPSSMTKLGDKEYDPRDGMMEYKRGVFDGLKELVDANKAELIKIDLFGTIYEFYTVKDKKLFDGQSIQVKLMRKTDDE